MLTRIIALERAFELESNTLTLIPSIPSTIESEAAVTSKEVDVAPEAIVAVPERTSISEVEALSTVAPLLSPITVQEKSVSAETAELAVIVNVIAEPSSTLDPVFVTVNVGAAEPLTPLLAIVISELPAVDPEDGSVGTPIAEAKAARVFDEPAVPVVALPPTSYVKLLAPLIVTTAPLDKVN